MGSFLLASCICGYQSKTIQHGVGFNYSEDGSFYEVAYCDACKQVIEANAGQTGVTCKRCKAPVRFYREDIDLPVAIKTEFGLPKTDYLDQKEFWHCPKCKGDTLAFSSGGIWD